MLNEEQQGSYLLHSDDGSGNLETKSTDEKEDGLLAKIKSKPVQITVMTLFGLLMYCAITMWRDVEPFLVTKIVNLISLFFLVLCILFNRRVIFGFVA